LFKLFERRTCVVDKFDPFAAEPDTTSKSPVNVSNLLLLFIWKKSFVTVTFYQSGFYLQVAVA